MDNGIEKYLTSCMADISSVLTAGVMDAARFKGEEVLRRHVRTDIYGKYSPREGAWVGGSTYQRGYSITNSVYSYIEGDTVCITALADPGPSVGSGSVEGPLIVFVQGSNFGFWTHGFPRDAVGPAQAEVDSAGFAHEVIQQGISRLMASGVLSRG